MQEAARLSPAVVRVAEVLWYLGRHPDQRFTMSTLARELSMNKATTHTLLQTLTKHGFLLRHPAEKTYRLGPALVGLGESAALDEHEAADFAHAEMGRLSDELGLMCWAGAAVGEEIVILTRVAPDSRLRGHPRIGQEFPFAAPVGPVFVAWSSLAEVDAWIDRAAEVLSDDRAFYHGALRDVRERGFAVNLVPMPGSAMAETIEDTYSPDGSQRDGFSLSQAVLRKLPPAEHGDSANAVANLIAPVFHADGRVLLSLTIEAPVSGVERELLAYGRRLLQAAAGVTASIRGTPPAGWAGLEFMA